MLPLVIDPGSTFNLVASAIEVYPHETMGFIIGEKRYRRIGRKRRLCVVAETAYPLQTADRAKTWVDRGNLKAFQRARTAIGTLGRTLLGEYHSHPEAASWMSEGDKVYSHGQLNGHDGHARRNWLELILAVTKKTYTRPHGPGWSWRDYTHKAGCTVKLDGYTGYDVTFGAYWGELDEETDRVRWQEGPVYIPWINGYWHR